MTQVDDQFIDNSKGTLQSKVKALLFAFALFGLLLYLPAPNGISAQGWGVIAVGALMLTLWITEAIPIPATAILPILLFPIMDLMTIKQATANYSHPIVFLFMGGFIIALAMEKWKLHLRIALSILRLTGTHPSGIIAGFMIATAFLSMWMSNTATTVMMLPIAMSVLRLLLNDTSGDKQTLKNQQYFALSLMIGVAYAANIGGTATLIGTPPNAILAGYLYDTYNYQIEFADWLMIGGPFMLVMLVICWALLTIVVYPSNMGRLTQVEAILEQQWQALGKMSRAELSVLCIFVFTAFMWMFKGLIPWFSISDTGIAIAAAILMFLTPADTKKGVFVLEWEDTGRLPWGILLLFGGGLSLAGAMQSSGLIAVIGTELSGMSALGVLPLLIITVCVVLFMTEVMSNLALITVFLPVLAGMALQLGEHPLFFMIASTLAASCAFMLPMSTPPNAIVFASGYIRISQMIRAGIIMNIVSITFIILATYTIIDYVFDVRSMPESVWLH